MAAKTPKIAVAGFHHETNTFAPSKTPYEEFVKDDGWPGLVEGEAVIDALAPLNLGLGGFINASRAKQWQLLPILWCNAEPFAHVTEDAYERIAGKIVDQIGEIYNDSVSSSLDGIYLCMHGAMVAEHSDDGEGELLSRLRAVVGNALPIVVSLDLHANLTPRMFELADGLTIFRTYPHVDMAETGERAFELLEHMVTHSSRPAKSYHQVPFLIPLPSQDTGSSPCREVYEQVAALPQEQAEVLSVDFACGFPPADIPECGASVVSYALSQNAADQAAKSILNTVVEAEQLFVADILTADEAVKKAMTVAAESASAEMQALPVVIADIQDNPGAGGSGDTTGLLAALVNNNARNAVLACIWDPVSAASCVAAGRGSELALSLGGNNGPEGVVPFEADFRVEEVTDGRFVCHGPMMKGTEVKIGPTVLLSVKSDNCDVQVIVSSERAQCLDQGFLRLVGIEPANKSIICVKSTVHFRNDFESISSHILLAACPGANPCNLEEINYTKLRSSVRLPRSATS